MESWKINKKDGVVSPSPRFKGCISAAKNIAYAILTIIIMFGLFKTLISWHDSRIIYKDKKYIFLVNNNSSIENNHKTVFDGIHDIITPQVYEKFGPFLRRNVDSQYDLVVIMQRIEEARGPWTMDETGYKLLILFLKNSSKFSHDFGSERRDKKRDAVAYYTEGVTDYGDLVCVGYASAGYFAIQEISPERLGFQAYLEFSPADGVEGRHLRCEDKELLIDEEFQFGGLYWSEPLD